MKRSLLRVLMVDRGCLYVVEGSRVVKSPLKRERAVAVYSLVVFRCRMVCVWNVGYLLVKTCDNEQWAGEWSDK